MRFRRLRWIFASAAALTLVVGGFAVTRGQQHATTPDSAAIAQPQVNAGGITATVVVVATAADLGARDVVHVSATPWPGQRAMLSVCLRNAYNAATPKPCMYEADFTMPVRGQTLVLRNLTFSSGNILAHTVRGDLGDVRARNDVLVGPITARVVQVKDGDTVQIAAETLPGYFVTTDIRIGGIDTPEKGGRADCPSEAARATRATAATRSLIEGQLVQLSNVAFEKYGARMLGSIRTQGGVDAAENLITQGLARAYDGGTKQSWCTLSAR